MFAAWVAVLVIPCSRRRQLVQLARISALAFGHYKYTSTGRRNYCSATLNLSPTKIDITEERVEYIRSFRLRVAVGHLLTQVGSPQSLSHSVNKVTEI